MGTIMLNWNISKEKKEEFFFLIGAIILSISIFAVGYISSDPNRNKMENDNCVEDVIIYSNIS